MWDWVTIRYRHSIQSSIVPRALRNHMQRGSPWTGRGTYNSQLHHWLNSSFATFSLFAGRRQGHENSGAPVVSIWWVAECVGLLTTKSKFVNSGLERNKVWCGSSMAAIKNTGLIDEVFALKPVTESSVFLSISRCLRISTKRLK